MVKAKVDENTCIWCGTCTIMCPNAFKLNDEMKAEFIEDSEVSEEEIDSAIEGCPVNAISK